MAICVLVNGIGAGSVPNASVIQIVGLFGQSVLLKTSKFCLNVAWDCSVGATFNNGIYPYSGCSGVLYIIVVRGNS